MPRRCPRWRRAWPAIVKPAYQDASIGIDQTSVVTSQKELDARVRQVLGAFGPPVLVERYVPGREFHVNIVEEPGAGPLTPPTVLPLAEIAFKNDKPGKWAVYTFTAKWDENSTEYANAPLIAPVEIPAEDFARIAAVAQRSFRALGCRDYARIDARMDAAGKFYVLEVNPNPYLNSPGAGERAARGRPHAGGAAGANGPGGHRPRRHGGAPRRSEGARRRDNGVKPPLARPTPCSRDPESAQGSAPATRAGLALTTGRC